MLSIPPVRYTLAAYRGASDNDSVRVWYHCTADADAAFRAWYDERRLLEVRVRMRQQAEKQRDLIASELAARGVEASKAATAKLEALEAQIAQCGDGSLDDMWQDYARALSPVIRSVELRGARLGWPSDPADRERMLRELGPHLAADMMSAIYEGRFDESLVGKP